MSAPMNPFTAEDYRKLKDQQRKLHDMLPLLDKGKACGVDCQPLCEMRMFILNTLEQIELNFFTPPPV